jgi:hypothetical protein
MITPSAGTKLYEGTFSDGMVIKSVGGRKADPHMYDGNYVVASKLKRPWRKQLNILAAYVFFYNPIRLVTLLAGKKTKVSTKAAGMQVVGMMGVLATARRTSGWAVRLMLGNIERLAEPPGSAVATTSCSTNKADGLVQLGGVPAMAR